MKRKRYKSGGNGRKKDDSPKQRKEINYFLGAWKPCVNSHKTALVIRPSEREGGEEEDTK